MNTKRTIFNALLQTGAIFSRRNKYLRINPLLPILCIILLLALASNTVKAQEREHRIDSLRKALTTTEGDEKLNTYLRLASMYTGTERDEKKRDTVLAIDGEMEAEAIRQGNKNMRTVALVNILGTFNSAKMFDEVIKRAPKTLKTIAEEGQWRSYYVVYSKLTTAYRRKGQLDKAMSTAEDLYRLAREKQDAGGMGTALYDMGLVYGSLRRFGEKEKALKECIELLQDSTSYFNILADAYIQLGIAYCAMRRYDDALAVADEIERFIPRHAELIKGTPIASWIMMYDIRMTAYRLSNRWDEAEYNLNKEDSLRGGTVPFYEDRAHILMGRKRFPEALEMIEKALTAATPVTVPQVKGLKMEILMRMGGREDEAIKEFEEIVELIDAEHNKEVSARLDEIRTEYEVDKYIAQKERNRNYFLFALGGCFLLAITLGIYIYFNRKIVQKNRELIRKAQQWAEVKPSQIITDKEEENAEEEIPRNVEPDEMDKLLFAEIEKEMEGGLFKDPNLSLDMLSGKTSSNPTYISKSVSHCTGKTFKAWINEYRIKEAVRLLSDKEKGNISIDTLALDSGFNDRTTFYRAFKKATGLSPSDFKKKEIA
jgi:AraC-like DNA-binding protein